MRRFAASNIREAPERQIKYGIECSTIEKILENSNEFSVDELKAIVNFILLLKNSECHYNRVIVCDTTDLSVQHEENNEGTSNMPFWASLTKSKIFVRKEPECAHSQDQISFFICHNESNSVDTYCIVHRPSVKYCLYTTFRDRNIQENVESFFQFHFGGGVVFKHKKNLMGDTKSESHAIFSLLYMLTAMNSFGKEEFVENFESLTPNVEEVKNVITDLKKELGQEFKEIVKKDILDLSKDEDFKTAISNQISRLPSMELYESHKVYMSIAQSFAEKVENGSVQDADIKKLNEARDKQTMDVSQWTGNDATSNFSKKFAGQIEKFQRMFNYLMKSKVDENLFTFLKEICSRLGLNFDFLHSYFIGDKSDDTKKSLASPPSFIDVLMDKLPEPRGIDPNFYANAKSNEQIFDELKMDDAAREDLRISYSKVKEKYELWKAKGGKEIYEWANIKKGKLKGEEIFEAIAVMDRLNELVTGFQKLHDTQILAILSFLQETKDKKRKGRLIQIETGEGKTIIIAILAAIMAFRNKKVDIVTSNRLLAKVAIMTNDLFFKFLNLNVGCNELVEGESTGQRACYACDIVYGTIGDFQSDYLKDSFMGRDTRAGRKFTCIILDEVDSMIIDSANHITKLSEPLPGMEYLKYVHIKIWQELNVAMNSIVLEINDKVKEEALEMCQSSGVEKQDKYEDLIEILESSRGRITEHILESQPLLKIKPIMPFHVMKYAEMSLHKWIDSAFNAKLYYNEDEQYVIREKDGEKVIVPVDFANTGVTLKNTVWQHGLHQFLQIKHNLNLTAESLTSCFISNLSYIKKYGLIYGSTGTLGSKPEQNLFASIYDVDCVAIPTFKVKQFTELLGNVVDDEDFIVHVLRDVEAMLSENRSVLIICKTIKDAKEICDNLKDGKKSIRAFLDDNHPPHGPTVNPSQVIIATNIAGRGTDFVVSEELAANGGLHVSVTFLPCNQRVEDQAFGRTSRQGKPGTAGLILRRSDLVDLMVESHSSFEEIKKSRDCNEEKRIAEIKTSKVPELEFQDKLFQLFSALFDDLRQSKTDEFVLKDLKEFWAFWLERRNSKGSEPSREPSEIFMYFKKSAHAVIQGSIEYNPFYSIQQAEYFIVNGNLERAETAAKHALKISRNPEILHSAYFKLFNISMERGQVFLNKCKALFAPIFNVSLLEQNVEYKDKAHDYLRQASNALQMEIDYIYNLFEDQDFKNNLNVEPKNNHFLRHISGRKLALQQYLINTNNMIMEITDPNFHDGIAISGRYPDFFMKQVWETSDETDEVKELRKVLPKSELQDLTNVGTNIIFELQKSHHVCGEIIKYALIQIAAGITVVSGGLFFPPAALVASAIGGNMIIEGICDIVVELLRTNKDGDFDRKSYVRAKVVSYGLNLIFTGFMAAKQCPKILDEARKACISLSSALQRCQVFRGICKFLSSQLLVFEQMFARMMLEFGKRIGRTAQLLSGWEVVTLTQSWKVRVLGTNIINRVIDQLISSVKFQIMPLIASCVRSHVNKDLLKHINRENLAAILGEIPCSMSSILDKVAINLSQFNISYKLHLIYLIISKLISSVEILIYASNFCHQLNEKMIVMTDENIIEDVGLSVNDIAERIFDNLENLVFKSLKDALRDLRDVFK